MEQYDDVAHLRGQINLEIEALHFMASGPAQVGSHRIIAFRYKSLVERCKQLGQHIGEKEAFQWAIERMNERG